MKQVQPVQRNIYYSNIYKKDLGRLHFDDTPGILSAGKNISKHLFILNNHETNEIQYAEMYIFPIP